MRDNNGRFTKGYHWRTAQAFRSKEWLEDNYVKNEISSGDISKMFGVTDAAILFWLKKHGIPRRTVSGARKIKHWGLSGVDNPMWNMRGELNHNWKGGVTAERQAFYTSREWKRACSSVWKRDNATCRRCESPSCQELPFHIHHVVSFSDKNLRADVGNLVLLCEPCHQFVHSRKNIDREYLPKK